MRLSLTLIAVVASIALTQDIASDEPTKVHVLWEPEKVADDAEWAAARQKGDDLICRLEATDEAAGRLNMDTRTPPSARNQWPDAALTSEISLWGWFTGEYDQKSHCQFADDNEDYHVNKVGTMFQDLGINSRPHTKGGDNVCYSIEHYNEHAEDDDGDTLAAQDQYYDINGVWERCTGAHVRFGINQRGGLIIGLDFLNPRTAALANWDDSPAEASLPELKRASDIMMAYWLRGNIDPKSLKYYLVLTIKNTMTLALINRVLKNHGLKEVPYWPGVIANMYDEEGPALLGSPLGRTLAFLLFQHKAELGTKHVTEIVIFRNNYPKHLRVGVHLLFRIKDVPNPAPAPAPAPAPGTASFRSLRLRSSVLDDGRRNKMYLHEIFQDNRALVMGSA